MTERFVIRLFSATVCMTRVGLLLAIIEQIIYKPQIRQVIIIMRAVTAHSPTRDMP
jgi:hypothetical protein